VSWPTVKIEDIFEVARGGSPRPIDDFITDDPSGVNWIMIGDTQEGGKYIDRTAKRIRRDGVRNSRQVKEGDFLLTNSMSFGRPYILRTSGCIHDGWLVLSPKSDEIHTDYFYYYLGSKEVRAKLSAKAAGAVVKNLNKEIVKALEIPLPPLAEQKRIAAILDKADAIRRKRQQAIQLADEFLRSVFLDMFGDPVTNPKGWDVRPVGEVCDCIVPGRDKPKSFSGSIPWITTNELNHLGTTYKSEKFLGLSGEEIEEVRAKIVAPNSVIMTCVGDLGIVSIAGEQMVINQQLHAFLPNKNITPSFLSFALAWQKGYMLNMASSTTLPYMNKSVCNSVPVILPPKNLQNKFEEFSSLVSCLKLKMQAVTNEPIIEALSKKAFSGQL